MTFTDDMSPYGFIAPTGNYIPIGWGEHTEWAFTYLDQNNQYDDFYHSDYDYPVDYLVHDRGFILIDSPHYGEPMVTVSVEKPITGHRRKPYMIIICGKAKKIKQEDCMKEINMCKYCTVNIEERENYILTPDNDSYGGGGIKVKEILSQGDGETVIFFTDDKMLMRNGRPVELAMAYRIPYSYCPFCGRKLED